MNAPRPHHERRMVACVAIQASQAPLEMRQYDSPTHAVEEAIDLFRTDENLCVLASVLDTGGSEEAWQAQQRHVEGLLRELGQPGLFITLPVQDMVRHLLTEDVIYEDFGVVAGDATHRSERIYAVIHADLPQPARSVAKKAGNLPRPNRSFVGRESEVARLQSLLIDRTLVTVLGPPGVGKSALTLHVARSLVDECEDGAWWFPVDDCASLDELLARMAREPGMIEMPGVATPRRVAEALGPKHALLVLDGGERLRTDVAQLCEHLLQCCPNVTTVVTSCERLEIEGEFIFNVLPLSLGDDQSEMNEYTLLTSDALNLLYERASQSGVLLPMSTSAIEKAMRICRQADGLPMYIELLASALRHTSLEGLERSLLEVGGICTHADGSVATKASEQVFRAGFAMLPEAERALLGRLSLFTTGWDIEAVGAVLGDAGTEVDQLAELHKSLFERSWISYDTDLDRYRMLKPLRAFLIRRQPSSALHQHVRGLATLASTWTAGLEGARSARCTMLLDQHYADFVVALELALEEPKLEQEAGQLFQCLASYWVRRNILEDAMQFASKSLRHGQGLLFARAAMMAGVVALRRRQYSRAAQSFEDARLACSRLSYSVGEAVALCNQAMAMSDSGHIDEALAVYEDGLNFMR
ncbi:MAG TPA: AAA family ATPase, partial [Fimbriimonadaceae bacterium]|nr:AAA family ATPase [Fimbriimonadaceae bacterium]